MKGSKDPWPLHGRLDQRDARLSARPAIKPYGCAFMLTTEVGRYLADPAQDPASDLYIERWTPLQIIALYDTACEKGYVRARDAFIEDWDKVIDLAAGRNAVDSLGWKDADYPYSEDEIVIDCWERQDMNVGQHFTVQIPQGGIQYDPLGSAEPGLSNSRKYGIIVSKRAFKIRY